MKTRNAEVKKNIENNLALFQMVRRSDISSQIRLRMSEKGLRNVDLAERLGVSEANISRWLRGNQNLSLETLYSLADAIEEPLHISVGEMSHCATGIDKWQRADTALHQSAAQRAKGGAEDEARSSDRTHGNVVSLNAYAHLRSQRTIRAKASSFSATRSEYGLLISDDRMVN